MPGARIEWHGPELERLVDGILVEDLRDCGRLLKAEGRRAVSTPYPPASRPGKAPHLRSGKLRRYINYLVDSHAKKLFFGCLVAYAGHLEKGTRRMKKRPFIAPTFDRLRAQLARMATRGR